jgi:hypothetical protein
MTNSTLHLAPWCAVRILFFSCLLTIFPSILSSSLCLNMPVITRSQTRASMSSLLKPLEKSESSTSLAIKSSNTPDNVTECNIHSTNLNDEFMGDDSTNFSSTSLTVEHSNYIPRILPSLGQNYLSDTITHCDQPLSLVDFSNSVDNNYFVISNIPLHDNLKSSTQSHLPSHNSSGLDFSIMEEDCADVPDYPIDSGWSRTTQAMTEMNTIFAAITEHITKATTKISNDFQQTVASQDNFKQEIRAEMNELRQLFAEQKRILGIDSTSSPTPPYVSSQQNTSRGISPSSTGQASSTPPLSTVSSTTDFQAQMMVMLTKFFSKLSSALTEKCDTKADWPKFGGDIKKFCSWYIAIMAQLSLPPWTELYDSSTNDAVLSTQNTSLNGKLYSKLLLALEGSALQSIVSQKHLRANGLLLLRDLVQAYKPKNVPEIIALKTGEFWSNTKCYPNESIDAYFNRFHELLDDLSDAEEPIPVKSAVRHFIFTLGVEFEAIQSNYRIGNLPSPWNTQDWPMLLVLCRDYYNSVKPF